MKKNDLLQSEEYFKAGNLSEGYRILFSLYKKYNNDPGVLTRLGLYASAMGLNNAAKIYFQHILNSSCFVQGSSLLNIYNFSPPESFSYSLYKYTRPKKDDELIRLAQTSLLCRGKVLEMGCGSGEICIYAALNGCTAFGIDNNPLAVEAAREKAWQCGLEDALFDLQDFTRLNLPDSSFDTVVLAEVLEHVSQPSLILSEAKRLCRPGGRIIISVPNGYAVPDNEHIRIYNKNILRDQILETTESEPQWVNLSTDKWLLCYVKNSKNTARSEKHNTNDFKTYFLPPHPTSKLDRSGKVSIIVPTYNRAEYLPHALDSIFQQTYKNLEVIVVNDGSTDSTEQVLDKYKEKIIYLTKENGGKSSAVNLGLKYATGKYVWIFDDDDAALPRKLEVQIRKFQSDKSLGLIHTAAFCMDKKLSKVLSVWNPLKLPQKEILKTKLLGCFFHGLTVIAKKEYFDQAGPWDERLIRAQDYDMWIRMAKICKIDILPFPTVMYRMHDGLRGEKDNRFSYTEIPKKTLEYERIIFKKLYQRLKLDDIFPEAKQNTNKQIEAYITRAYAMAKRGLYSECIKDVNAAYSLVQGKGLIPLSLQTINLLRLLAKSLTGINPEAAQKTLFFLQMVANCK